MYFEAPCNPSCLFRRKRLIQRTDFVGVQIVAHQTDQPGFGITDFRKLSYLAAAEAPYSLTIELN